MAQLATESQTAENSQPGSPQVSEQQIACMAADLFVSMLSMDLEYEPGTEFESIDGSLQSTVEISGTWSARLRVVASSDLTATIACAMFDMDLDELTDSELHDALGGNCQHGRRQCERPRQRPRNAFVFATG